MTPVTVVSSGQNVTGRSRACASTLRHGSALSMGRSIEASTTRALLTASVLTTTARITPGVEGVGTASAIVRLSERVDTLDASLRQEITDLRLELRDGLAESRRHAVMLNESTREDIRFVAEAVANLTVKIDSLRR
jgi:hypothetical protein